MKSIAIAFLSFGASLAFGVDTGPTPATLSPKSQAPKPVTNLGVCTSLDKRALVLRYDLAGVPHEQRVAFPGEITDFRYCNWMGSGIALAASVRTSAITEFHFTTFFPSEREAAIKTNKVPAPEGQNQLSGITNTQGDAIIITALRQADGQRIAGWMYIDNCPRPGWVPGHVVSFDIAADRTINQAIEASK